MMLKGSYKIANRSKHEAHRNEPESYAIRGSNATTTKPIWTDGRTDGGRWGSMLRSPRNGRTHGQTDGWTNGRTDGQTDGRTRGLLREFRYSN